MRSTLENPTTAGEFAKHGNLLGHFVRDLLPNDLRGSAEDLTQDTLEDVWAAYGEAFDAGSFDGDSLWGVMKAAGRNKVIDHCRAHGRHEEILGIQVCEGANEGQIVDTLASMEADPAFVAESRLDAEGLRRELERNGTTERQLEIVLMWVEGYSSGEIAEKFAIDESAVRKTKTKGFAKLLAVVTERQPELAALLADAAIKGELQRSAKAIFKVAAAHGKAPLLAAELQRVGYELKALGGAAGFEIVLQGSGKPGVLEQIGSLGERARDQIGQIGARTQEVAEPVANAAASSGGTKGAGTGLVAAASAKFLALGAAGKAAVACVAGGTATAACVAAVAVTPVGDLAEKLPVVGGSEPPRQAAEELPPTPGSTPVDVYSPSETPDPAPAPTPVKDEQASGSEPKASSDGETKAVEEGPAIAPTEEVAPEAAEFDAVTEASIASEPVQTRSPAEKQAERQATQQEFGGP